MYFAKKVAAPTPKGTDGAVRDICAQHKNVRVVTDEGKAKWQHRSGTEHRAKAGSPSRRGIRGGAEVSATSPHRQVKKDNAPWISSDHFSP